MHFLPCLRCGRDSVGVSLLSGATRRENVWCLAKDCEAVHYLRIAPDAGGLEMVYDRYTLGYPLERYDERDFTNAPGTLGPKAREDEGFSGPVAVFPRKRRFSGPEAVAVWKASKGRCHLCGKKWPSGARGPKGWQVDHVIPHAGGDATERAGHYRMACAKCAPGKGPRARRARLRKSIRDLAMRLTPSA